MGFGRPGCSGLSCKPTETMQAEGQPRIPRALHTRSLHVTKGERHGATKGVEGRAFLASLKKHKVAVAVIGVIAVLAALGIGLGLGLATRASTAKAEGQQACSCPEGLLCIPAGSAAARAQHPTDGRTCVHCLTDNDCNGAETCSEMVCRQACASHSDCGGKTGHCAGGACVACVNDGDCAGSATGNYCYRGACVECMTSTQCPTNHSCVKGGRCAAACDSENACPANQVCSGAAGHCVGCTKNGDCGGATPLCAPDTDQCVQCLADSDCKFGHCNTEQGTCETGVCPMPKPASSASAQTSLFTMTQGEDSNMCLTSVTCPSTAFSPPFASTLMGARCLSWSPCTNYNSEQLVSYVVQGGSTATLFFPRLEIGTSALQEVAPSATMEPFTEIPANNAPGVAPQKTAVSVSYLDDSNKAAGFTVSCVESSKTYFLDTDASAANQTGLVWTTTKPSTGFFSRHQKIAQGRSTYCQTTLLPDQGK